MKSALSISVLYCPTLEPSSLCVDLHVGGGLYEHLEAGHEGADLGEVALAHHLGVEGQPRVVVVLLEAAHDLVQALQHRRRQL